MTKSVDNLDINADIILKHLKTNYEAKMIDILKNSKLELKSNKMHTQSLNVYI